MVEDDLPGGAGKHALAELRHERRISPRAAGGEREARHVGGEHPVPVLQEHAALVVEELAVLPCVPVYLQVGAFSDALCVGDRPVGGDVADPAVAGHLPWWGGVRGEAGDQLVLHADEEHRAAGIALPAGPPAELVVHAGALVPACADDVEAAQLRHLSAIAIAATEADIGT